MALRALGVQLSVGQLTEITRSLFESAVMLVFTHPCWFTQPASAHQKRPTIYIEQENLYKLFSVFIGPYLDLVTNIKRYINTYIAKGHFESYAIQVLSLISLSSPIKNIG